MKNKLFYLNLSLLVLLLSILTTLFLPLCFAENYTQMGLPENAIARLGKGRIKHMLYSPNGDTLAVVTSIGIWLYDTKTYQELNLLPISMHKNIIIAPEITNTTYSVDGQTLISDINEQLIFLWDITSGESREIWKGDGVYFDPDRKTFTIEKEDTTIQLYQETKRDLEHTLNADKEKPVSFAFSPDGQTLAIIENKYNYMIKIRDTRTHKLKYSLTGFSEFFYLNEIALSPDGNTLATLSSGKPIRLWDVTTGKIKKTLTGYKVSEITNRHLNRIRYASHTVVDRVAFSPDGNTLACGNRNGTIRLWNVNSGKLKKTSSEHQSFITGLTFSPDGKLLASGSEEGLILVWNLKTGDHAPFLAERMGPISCVTFSRDGSMLAGGNKDGNIHLFDVATGNPKMTFTGHIEEINQVLFSPDGDMLASRSFDGTVRLWDIHTGKTKMTLSTPIENSLSGLLFADNGKLFAIRGEFELIYLLNVNSGQYEKILMGHTSFTRNYSISISADRQILASNNADGTILFWDLSSIVKATD